MAPTIPPLLSRILAASFEKHNNEEVDLLTTEHVTMSSGYSDSDSDQPLNLLESGSVRHFVRSGWRLVAPTDTAPDCITVDPANTFLRDLCNELQPPGPGHGVTTTYSHGKRSILFLVYPSHPLLYGTQSCGTWTLLTRIVSNYDTLRQVLLAVKYFVG